MSMDPWLIIQVIMLLVYLNSTKRGTPSGRLTLLLLASWIAPIFVLGWLKAILVWVISMVTAAIISAIKDALVGEKKSVE